MFTFKKDVTENLSANLAVNIIGIFGVIGSLIFLALEVNIAQESLSENTKLLRLQASLSANELSNNWRSMMIQSGDIWFRGLSGQELMGQEAENFSQLCEGLLFLVVANYEADSIRGEVNRVENRLGDARRLSKKWPALESCYIDGVRESLQQTQNLDLLKAFDEGFEISE